MEQHIQSEEDFKIHPQKVVLWVGMVSIVMLFAALSSALIVRQGEGNWNFFPMPFAFWVTSGLVILSSVSMHLAVQAAKRRNLSTLVTWLWISALLGLAFLTGQFLGWVELADSGIYFRDNPSNSFIIVLTGLHGLHLVGGIIAVIFVLIKALLYKYKEGETLGIELCATYWHFMGALWIYLFFFLLYHYS
jgi:cytochrome c oxidase subunit 3